MAGTTDFWKYGLPVNVDAGDTGGIDYWKYGLPVVRYAPSAGTSAVVKMMFYARLRRA